MEQLLGTLTDLHTHIWGAAAVALKSVHDDPTSAPVAIVLAFALGMVHALMPGHGKSVVFSYFLSQGARISTGVAMALKIAGLHVATAIVLLLVVGATVLRLGRLQGAGRVLEIASYTAVALMGAWLLYRAVTRMRQMQASDEPANRESSILAYAIGLLPCPLTIILMNYAIVNGTMIGGLMLTAVMACGIAATMTLTGLIAIVVRRALVQGFARATVWYGWTMRGIEIGGALMILGLGIAVLVWTL